MTVESAGVGLVRAVEVVSMISSVCRLLRSVTFLRTLRWTTVYGQGREALTAREGVLDGGIAAAVYCSQGSILHLAPDVVVLLLQPRCS